MNNEKDELKECIAREFEEIAKEEEESLEKDTSLVVPEGTVTPPLTWAPGRCWWIHSVARINSTA